MHNKPSLESNHIEAEGLIEEVIIANGSDIADIIKESNTIMIF